MLITCDFSPTEMEDEPVWTDVVYTQDGKGVTIYLDGTGTYVPSSRALNLPLAKLGHDLFEVTFLYKPNDGGQEVLARASWESGQKAGVSGVQRDVDYKHITVNPTPPGEGSVVLFIGRKEDRTLLAIGRLAMVDGVPNSTLITSSTKSITFSVDALKAGVGQEPSSSSLFTNYHNTALTPDEVRTSIIKSVKIAQKAFPLYKLAKGSQTRGEYHFAVESGLPFNQTYGSAIVRAVSGTTLHKIKAKYTLPDGNERQALPALQENAGKETIISWENNFLPPSVSPAALFQNPVKFIFDNSAAEDETLFAFVFSVAVHAFSDQKDAIRWFIRPGFGTYLYDLDGGGAGGAILAGTGDFIEHQGDPRFYISVRPTQLQYNEYYPTWIFNLTDMRLIYVPPDNNPVPIDHDDPRLHYYLDKQPVGSTRTEISWASIRDGLIDLEHYPHGVYSVVIEFHEGGVIYADWFRINVGGATHGDFSDVDPEHRWFINNIFELDSIFTIVGNLTGPTNLLFVFNCSIDLARFYFPTNFAHTYIFLAGNDYIAIGRSSSGSVATNWGPIQHTLYLGEWPYPAPIRVGGNVVDSKPFIFHVGGSFQEVEDNNWAQPNPPSPAPAPFFSNGGTGVLPNVIWGNTITVYYPQYLGVPYP